MAPFLVLSCIFFPVKREAKFTKKQPIDCLKKPINLQENEKQLLQLPTNWPSYGLTRHLYRLKTPESEQFQNGYSKVVLNFILCNFGEKSYL